MALGISLLGLGKVYCWMFLHTKQQDDYTSEVYYTVTSVIILNVVRMSIPHHSLCQRILVSFTQQRNRAYSIKISVLISLLWIHTTDQSTVTVKVQAKRDMKGPLSSMCCSVTHTLSSPHERVQWPWVRSTCTDQNKSSLSSILFAQRLCEYNAVFKQTQNCIKATWALAWGLKRTRGWN